MFNKKTCAIDEAEDIIKRATEDADSRQADMLNKLIEFVKNDLPRAKGMALIWREGNEFKQMYWKSGGIEPAEAILLLDQLHHRIQHEGLKDYD